MTMQYLGLVTIVVRDYDEAISYYRDVLGFSVLEDEYQPAQDKRWVVVSPLSHHEQMSSSGCAFLLAKAKNDEEASRIGNQTGGRVGFFLYVDEFDQAYHEFSSKDVKFLEKPRVEQYGKVAVFQDLYGNKWDLFEKKI
jgi:uncharacterized glyoxalase superfamily protein PhnB